MTMVVCNGRRIGRRAAAELLHAVQQHELGALMMAQGFVLKPVRAPRDLTNGDLVLRLTWSKTEANATITVRSTVRLHPPL